MEAEQKYILFHLLCVCRRLCVFSDCNRYVVANFYNVLIINVLKCNIFLCILLLFLITIWMMLFPTVQCENEWLANITFHFPLSSKFYMDMIILDIRFGNTVCYGEIWKKWICFCNQNPRNSTVYFKIYFFPSSLRVFVQTWAISVVCKNSMP